MFFHSPHFYKIKAGEKATRRGMGQIEDPKRNTKRGLATKRTPPEFIQDHCTKQRHSPTKKSGQPHEEHETKRARDPEEERGRERPQTSPGGSTAAAVGVPTRRVGRVVGVGVRLPSHHHKISGPVAKYDGILGGVCPALCRRPLVRASKCI